MQEGIWEPDLYYILLYGMACVDCNIYCQKQIKNITKTG